MFIVTQTNKCFYFNSQDVAAHMGNRQTILEEYTNCDGMYINYNA
jgi:hypothetical protein